MNESSIKVLETYQSEILGARGRKKKERKKKRGFEIAAAMFKRSVESQIDGVHQIWTQIRSNQNKAREVSKRILILREERDDGKEEKRIKGEEKEERKESVGKTEVQKKGGVGEFYLMYFVFFFELVLS